MACGLTGVAGSILVDGNGWDRYRIANQANYDDYVRHGFPMGRLGTAEEVADVIVFLGLAARPLDQWTECPGGWAGAAVCSGRLAPVLIGPLNREAAVGTTPGRLQYADRMIVASASSTTGVISASK